MLPPHLNYHYRCNVYPVGRILAREGFLTSTNGLMWLSWSFWLLWTFKKKVQKTIFSFWTFKKYKDEITIFYYTYLLYKCFIVRISQASYFIYQVIHCIRSDGQSNLQWSVRAWKVPWERMAGYCGINGWSASMIASLLAFSPVRAKFTISSPMVDWWPLNMTVRVNWGTISKFFNTKKHAIIKNPSQKKDPYPSFTKERNHSLTHERKFRCSSTVPRYHSAIVEYLQDWPFSRKYLNSSA